MTQTQTLHQFFSGFELPAYPHGAVPEGAALPYLTYEVKSGYFGDEPASLTASLWYYGAGETEPNEKAQEIGRALGTGGVLLPCDGGAIWLQRGAPWCVSGGGGKDDRGLKQRTLNITAEFLTL